MNGCGGGTPGLGDTGIPVSSSLGQTQTYQKHQQNEQKGRREGGREGGRKKFAHPFLVQNNHALIDLIPLAALGAAEDVDVELDHARLVGGLLVLLLLVVHALGHARHHGDARDDAAVEDAHAKKGHSFLPPFSVSCRAGRACSRLSQTFPTLI